MKQFDQAFNAKLLCGVDEVGRGPGAGPLVVCAIIMPKQTSFNLTKDSKGYSRKKREYYNELILNECIEYKIVLIDNEEIDRINILNATKKAMTEAIENLRHKPDKIIIDYVKLDLENSISFTKGDEKSFTIACASIVAKVYRDNLMCEYHKLYPEYNFNKNMGYLTKEHIQAINQFGLTPIHRKSFKKVSKQ